jgi:hypothetical protein
MNIFVLDLDPEMAAIYQGDKHVVKMVLESAQLLCAPYDPGVAPYKRTHYNHPCAKWARENASNYVWLLNHAWALAREYRFRYHKDHSCIPVIDWCYTNVYKLGLPQIDLSPFAQAMPDIYKNPDPVTAYRSYYTNEKSKIVKWNKGREKPDWYK